MANHLTWPNFKTTIIRSGEDRVHRVSADPLAEIYADRQGSRLRLEIQRSAIDPIDGKLCKLRMLEFSEREAGGANLLNLTCSEQSMFREAYLFFTAVIDRVLKEGEDAGAAFASELKDLEALIDTGEVLSMEKQIGLVGELMVLEQLIAAGGPAIISAWTGHLRESHDFRLGGHEFEVKTTTGRRRIHRINGLTQAVPSPDAKLSFISILLATAGPEEGATLPGHVKILQDLLAHDQAALSSLVDGLAASGYRAADAPAYGRAWKLRFPMAVVSVDAAFPAISGANLAPAMGHCFARLEDISYVVNLDEAGVVYEHGLVALFAEILNQN
jgi:hypothetical protein